MQQRWYYSSKKGETAGPVTEEELSNLVKAGTLIGTHKVVPEGETDWKNIDQTAPFKDQLPKDLAPPPTPPAAPAAPAPPPPPATPKEPNPIVEEVLELGKMLPVFALRTVSSKFHGSMASAREKKKLAAAAIPVTSAPLQNFLAWRRAMLALGAIVLLVAFGFTLPDYIKSFDEEDAPLFMHLTTVVKIAAGLATIALVAFALLKWSNFRSSRLFGRLAFGTAFVIPFLVFLAPVRWFTEFGDWIGGAIAGLYGFYLLALVLALFPAVLRSSIVMKSLVPESPFPGWIAVLTAPLLALYPLVRLVGMMQNGSFPGILCFAALTVAPLLALVFAKALLRPSSPEGSGKSLIPLRLGLLIGYGVALVGFAWWLINLDEDEVIRALGLSFSLVANFVLFSVVISDSLLGLVRFAHRQEEELRSGALHAALGSHIDQIASLEGAVAKTKAESSAEAETSGKPEKPADSEKPEKSTTTKKSAKTAKSSKPPKAEESEEPEKNDES